MASAKRELFKSIDVCEMAQLQPYVLRSWEAEFPGLGSPLRRVAVASIAVRTSSSCCGSSSWCSAKG